MNKFIGLGRFAADPDIRYSGETIIAKFTIAIDRKYKKEGESTADFITCVAFNKQAEFIEKYFKKGMRISFAGHIQTGNYTNKEGQKVYTTDIIVDECEFCESKHTDTPKAEQKTELDGFVDVASGEDAELPFN